MDLMARANHLDMVRDTDRVVVGSQLRNIGRKSLADEVKKLQQVRFWFAD